MTVTFTIEYQTSWGESLSLSLGDKSYPMQWNEGGVWTVSVKTTASALMEYGYAVIRDGIIARMEWESHRYIAPSGTKELSINDKWLDCPVPDCVFERKHQAAEFDKPSFRGSGCVVPVFSLRSEDDFGIGEFLDLRHIVDWAAATGMCIIQLLPVTDTTRHGGWDDSYPYSPISSFALHPLYVNLTEIGVPEDDEYLKLKKKFETKKELDYPAVYKTKMAYIRKAFALKGEEDMRKSSYKLFCRRNCTVWLDEYASFCSKRDGDTPDFWRWIQWHLDCQFYDVVCYARSKGVHFKGDLPIGVSGDSADAFWHPELFNLDSCAGAPPDFFSADGQNWGFPTYNWEEMSKTDYSWWKARLRHMSRYFDAYRIDHILGFFRIWEIPKEIGKGVMGHFNPALSYSAEEIESLHLPIKGLFLPDPRHEGYYHPVISPDTSSLEWWQKECFNNLHTDFFYHRNDGFWRWNAMKKLPQLLGSTGMLACGEDLGMVPDCVNEVMAALHILSFEMEMMDKGRPWPSLSVCSTSSHDMETLRMQYAVKNSGEDMPVSKVSETLERHLYSGSMLAIFPIQDIIALDEGLRRKDFMNERVNDPANPHHHWRYRIHFDVSELVSSHTLNSRITELLKNSGRYA